MFKVVRLNAITYPTEFVEREELARVGAVLTEIEGQRPDEILAAAEDCDALLVVSSTIPSQVIERLRHCQVISRLGAGTDKIDIATATRMGILVTNVPDFCLNEQAEHTMALLLAFHRRLPFMMDAMRTGKIREFTHKLPELPTPRVFRAVEVWLGALNLPFPPFNAERLDVYHLKRLLRTLWAVRSGGIRPYCIVEFSCPLISA